MNYDLRFNLYDASLNYQGRLNNNSIEPTYLPYSIINYLKDNTYFKNSLFVGTSNKHYYSIYSNTSYAIIFDIDLFNVIYQVHYVKKDQITNFFCFYNYNTQVCPNYVNYLSNNTFNEYNGWYRIFDDNGNSKTNMTSYFKLNVGSSYLDDFMFTNKSSDIFITSLYFFIPILLFILAIKVLRKGLFK